MSKVDSLVISLELDDHNLKGKLRVNAAELRRFAQEVNRGGGAMQSATRHSHSFGGSLRDMAITIGAARYALDTLYRVFLGLPMALIRVNAELESLDVLMKGLTNTTSSWADINKEAEQSMDFLFQLAQTSPVNLNALTDSFVKLKAAGLDPANRQLQALVDSVARFGGTDEQLKRASIAIQQMAGKGVISMEELRQQLGEAMPNAVKVMARSLSMPVGEMVKLISEGKVEAEGALKAMLQQMEFENAGSAKRLSETWNGLMNRLMTRWQLFARDVGDAGYFEDAKAALEELVDGFLTSNDAKLLAQELGQALAELVGHLRTGVIFVYQYRDAFMALIQGFIIFKSLKVAAAMGVLLTGAIVPLGKATISAAGGVGLFVKILAGVPIASGSAAAALTAQAGATNAVDVVTKRAAASAMTLAGSATALRGAFMALAGPIGIIAAVVGTLGAAYVQTRIRASELRRELSESIRDNLSEKEFETVERMVGRIDMAISNLTTEINGKKATLQYTLGNDKELEEGIKKLEADVKVYQREREVLLSSLSATVIEQTKRIAQRESTAAIDVITQEVDLMRREYAKALDDMEKAMIAEGVTSEVYQQRMEAEREKWMRDINLRQIELLEEQVEKELAILEARDNPDVASPFSEAEVAAAQIRMDAYLKAVTDLKIGMDRVGGLVIVEGLDDGNKKMNQAEQWMRRINERLEETKAKAMNANPYLAELTVRMKEWTEAGIDYDAQAMTDMAEQMFNVDRLLNLSRDAKSAVDDIINQVQTLDRQLNKRTTRSETTFGDFQNVIANYDEVETKLQDLRQASNQVEFDMAQVTEELGHQSDELVRLSKTAGSIEDLSSANAQILNNEILKRLTEERLSLIQEITEAKGQGVEVDEETIAALQNLLQLEVLTEETRAAIRDMIDLTQEAGEKADFLTRGWIRFRDDFSDISDQMEDVWYDAMDGMGDKLTDMILDGEADFASFFKNVARMITQLLVKMAMVKSLEASGIPFFSGGAEFANGGIMTGGGSVQLKKYARGGIARSPQLALFGEGSMPEAYVPLPDGRSIPVTIDMDGFQPEGSGQAVMVAPRVAFNLYNQSGERLNAEQQGDPRVDGEGFVVDVVLRNMSRPGPLRDAIKGSR